MSNSTFGFLVHPRNLNDVFKKIPILRFLPKRLSLFILKKIKPLIVSKITGLVDKSGREVVGYVISIPITAKQMMEDKNLALVKMKEAVKLAQKKGVRIIGLGGLTSSLSKGGMDLLDVEKEISFTTGRAYTVKTVTDYVKDVIKKFNLNKENVHVGIVGGAGSIGSGCAEILVKWGVKNFTLIDLERKLSSLEERMFTLKKTGPLMIKAEHQLSHIKNCDIIITATNAPEVVVRSEDLKSGAIIINDAQPSDISPEIYNRPDVLVIEGGVVKTPGIKSNFNMGLVDKEDNFCCLAEVLVLAYQNDTSSHFTIGNLDISYIEKIEEKSRQLNFSITKYQNDQGYLSETKIETIKKIVTAK